MRVTVTVDNKTQFKSDQAEDMIMIHVSMRQVVQSSHWKAILKFFGLPESSGQLPAVVG